MKLGTHPRNIHAKPSARNVSVRKEITPLLPCALMMRVLKTSTGEQIVVATNPAQKEAVKCVVRLSSNDVCARIMRLKLS